MTETQLYSLIHDSFIYLINALQLPISKFDFCRIESPSTPGIPDINVCIDGREFWIECKIRDKTKTRSQLRPMQKAWIRKRQDAGGKVFTLKYCIEDKSFLVRSNDKDEPQKWKNIDLAISDMLYQCRKVT